ncbi:Spo0E family sporulation regulatory protein-aspartic acid phosphatase [Geosporobacter subterraneus]|uniref:Spo0E family sporulation regulatory protein-aspartic acid phosphatase n=1 Tax=Geosporobacter subterraneus TaxID=390806 RepID=UPI001677CC0D|nr:Spo0E family sporulation regulatory protein-aspartic acid phosphatase [Geosporobacter subterraneus]
MLRSFDLLSEISILRNAMYILIEEAHWNLQDPNVQSISRLINSVIYSYTKSFYNI